MATKKIPTNVVLNEEDEIKFLQDEIRQKQDKLNKLVDAKADRRNARLAARRDAAVEDLTSVEIYELADMLSLYAEQLYLDVEEY